MPNSCSCIYIYNSLAAFSPLSGSQFQRCLNSHFGVTLSEEEQRGVLRKYDKKGTGMVNYREFCATVDNGVCVWKSAKL